jgi:hypothetical protein
MVAPGGDDARGGLIEAETSYNLDLRYVRKAAGTESRVQDSVVTTR